MTFGTVTWLPPVKRTMLSLPLTSIVS